MSTRSLTSVARRAWSRESRTQCLAPPLSRSMATEATPQPADTASTAESSSRLTRRAPPSQAELMATVYSFPSLEPVRFARYAANLLGLPLRRDILHRAVIYEGDSTRQGTASTKWRDDVHGSGHKIRPQKGQGMARLGDKKSPMLRGGGVAHGPKPRDFSTDLPRKIYDLAWRTALSYRYRKGELLLLDDDIRLDDTRVRWVRQILKANGIGQRDGGSLFVMGDHQDPDFTEAMANVGKEGLARAEDDVDVKDLLEKARVVVAKSALDRMLARHSSDISQAAPKAVYYD